MVRYGARQSTNAGPGDWHFPTTATSTDPAFGRFTEFFFVHRITWWLNREAPIPPLSHRLDHFTEFYLVFFGRRGGGYKSDTGDWLLSGNDELSLVVFIIETMGNVPYDPWRGNVRFIK